MIKDPEGQAVATISNLRSQLKSTRMWVAQHHQYNDEASKRNVAFALGRLSGMYGLAVQLVDIPEEISEEFKELGAVWDTL